MIGVTPPGVVPRGVAGGGLDASIPDPRAALLAESEPLSTYLVVGKPPGVSPVYLSNDGYASGAGQKLPDLAGTSLPHQKFRGRLLDGPSFEASVFAGGSITASASFGLMRFANTDRELDSYATYTWENAPVDLYRGRPGWTLDKFVPIGRGYGTGVQDSTPQYLSIGWRDLTQRLDVPAQKNTYKGLGAQASLDGVDDYGTATKACPAGSMTLECRVRARNLVDASRWFAGYRGPSGENERSLRFGTGLANRLAFVVSNDAGALFVAQAATAGAADTYLWLAGVLDPAAGKIRLYGRMSSTNAPLVLLGESGISGTFNSVRSVVGFGRAAETAAGYHLGELDEVRIWSVALTMDQIKQYMDREIPSDTPGLYAYWRFNEGTGTTAFATTGGANATLTGATWTGSLEGDSSLAGTLKIQVRGRAREVEPYLVDPQRLVYQVHDGPCEEISDAKIKGAASLTSAGDVANDTLLRQTSVAAGTYLTCKAQGLVRLGASPNGTLTFYVRGDNRRGYVETAAGISKQIALDAGLTEDDIDSVTYARALAAAPGPVGIVLRGEAPKADEQIVKLMLGVGGWRIPTRDGKLAFGVLDLPGTPKRTLTGTRDIASLTPVWRSTPVAGVRVAYRRNWRIQSSDVATSLSESARQDLAAEWRWAETPQNDSVVKDNPSAPWLEWEASHFDQESDALALANRLNDWFKVARRGFRVDQTEGLDQSAIDDDVKIVFPLEDLDSGWTASIYGYAREGSRESVTVFG